MSLSNSGDSKEDLEKIEQEKMFAEMDAAIARELKALKDLESKTVKPSDDDLKSIQAAKSKSITRQEQELKELLEQLEKEKLFLKEKEARRPQFKLGLLEEDTDITKHPGDKAKGRLSADVGSNHQITIGDLHGNALKLLHILVRHGIFEISENDYQRFAEIYEKEAKNFDFSDAGNKARKEAADIEAKQIAIGKEFNQLNPKRLPVTDPSLSSVAIKLKELQTQWRDLAAKKKEVHANDSTLTKPEIDEFHEILGRATVRAKPLLRLIGDDLGDRGANDYFTLKIFEKLHKQKVPYEVLFSDHGQEMVMTLKNSSGAHVIGNLTQKGSLLRFLALREDNRIPAQTDMISQTYLPHIKLISYSITKHPQDPDKKEMTLFTHAPVDVVKKVIALAKAFGLNSDVSTWQKLQKTIDDINTRFSEKLALGGPRLTEFLQIPEVDAIIWNRVKNDNELLQGNLTDKLADGTSIKCACGHDSGIVNNPNHTNLDNHLGKDDRGVGGGYETEGAYTALYNVGQISPQDNPAYAANVALRETFLKAKPDIDNDKKVTDLQKQEFMKFANDLKQHQMKILSDLKISASGESELKPQELAEYMQSPAYLGYLEKELIFENLIDLWRSVSAEKSFEKSPLNNALLLSDRMIINAVRRAREEMIALDQVCNSKAGLNKKPIPLPSKTIFAKDLKTSSDLSDQAVLQGIFPQGTVNIKDNKDTFELSWDNFLFTDPIKTALKGAIIGDSKIPDPKTKKIILNKDRLKTLVASDVSKIFFDSFKNIPQGPDPKKNARSPDVPKPQTLVINGHGSMGDDKFTLSNNFAVFTPGSLESPHVLHVKSDQPLEKDLKQFGKLRTFKDDKHKWVPHNKEIRNTKITALNPKREIHNFASDLARPNTRTDDKFPADNKTIAQRWQAIDGKLDPKINYLEQDADAKLILKGTNGYKALTNLEAKLYFTEIDQGKSPLSGFTPICLYAPRVNKIKILGDTSLKELTQVLQDPNVGVAQGTNFVLATCNYSNKHDVKNENIYYKDFDPKSNPDFDLAESLKALQKPDKKDEKPKDTKDDKKDDSISGIGPDAPPIVSSGRKGSFLDDEKIKSLLEHLNQGSTKDWKAGPIIQDDNKHDYREIHREGDRKRSFNHYGDRMITKDTHEETYKAMLKDWFFMQTQKPPKPPVIRTNDPAAMKVWEKAITDTIKELKLNIDPNQIKVIQATKEEILNKNIPSKPIPNIPEPPPPPNDLPKPGA